MAYIRALLHAASKPGSEYLLTKEVCTACIITGILVQRFHEVAPSMHPPQRAWMFASNGHQPASRIG